MYQLPERAVIDHLAIAVKNLEDGIAFYTQVLGFNLLERRKTEGAKTGMLSAVLGGPINGLTIVLIQGTTSESQVNQYIEKYGPGVQHAAFLVDDLQKTELELAERGIKFSTGIIQSSNLKQLFTLRDENSGMMLEFIERVDERSGFEETNIQELFETLEQGNLF